jgi:molecular chaperone GrpE
VKEPEEPGVSPVEEDVEEPEERTYGAAPPGVPAEPAESAVLRLEERVAESEERYLRLAAEFDNYRKRIARERMELGDRAQAALVIRLLEVLDDLDRLAGQDLSVTGREALHEALVLVDRKLRKELGQAGLERIEAEGAPFDPSVHEAVSVLPAPTPEQDRTVSTVFQAGYRFRGSLVRPARVQVYSSDAAH